MKFLSQLLCRLGIHWYERVPEDPGTYDFEADELRCSFCGKSKYVRKPAGA